MMRFVFAAAIILTPSLSSCTDVNDDDKAALKALEESFGITATRNHVEANTEFEKAFINDVTLPATEYDEADGGNRALQTLVICQDSDPEFDGVACLLPGYPVAGFNTGLVGCPLGTQNTGLFWFCDGCLVYEGDIERDDFCAGCTLCSDHDIGFDCTNTASGTCPLYNCQTGRCSPGSSVPPPTPQPFPRPTFSPPPPPTFGNPPPTFSPPPPPTFGKPPPTFSPPPPPTFGRPPPTFSPPPPPTFGNPPPTFNPPPPPTFGNQNPPVVPGPPPQFNPTFPPGTGFPPPGTSDGSMVHVSKMAGLLVASTLLMLGLL